eukprot:GHVU01113647.1.p1 GENE.GHVU01113647.1~~GHVU01113647.1.p1  ORF type:complete len:116 (+),score=15.07 GHVU01113647.1:160-507(+)
MYVCMGAAYVCMYVRGEQQLPTQYNTQVGACHAGTTRTCGSGSQSMARCCVVSNHELRAVMRTFICRSYYGGRRSTPAAAAAADGFGIEYIYIYIYSIPNPSAAAAAAGVDLRPP